VQALPCIRDFDPQTHRFPPMKHLFCSTFQLARSMTVLA
jgi:hypothetical protein